MKIHAMRLTRGMDLKKEIAKYASENHIEAGCILSAVGCLYKFCVRTADGKTVKTMDGNFEIVSATGTISKDGLHIHISVSDRELKTYGGHLKDNCLVNSTVELVLGEFENYTFERAMDENTGYKELNIIKK